MISLSKKDKHNVYTLMGLNLHPDMFMTEGVVSCCLLTSDIYRKENKTAVLLNQELINFTQKPFYSADSSHMSLRDVQRLEHRSNPASQSIDVTGLELNKKFNKKLDSFGLIALGKTVLFPRSLWERAASRECKRQRYLFNACSLRERIVVRGNSEGGKQWSP